MKKLFFYTLIILLFGYAFASGITPSYIYHAPGVAAGIGAKLLCSARYVSGFSEQQAFDDLVQYSPVLKYLSVDYNDEEQSVQTSLAGLSPTTARFYPGLGCRQDYPQYDTPPEPQALLPMPEFTSRWPHGNRVETINPAIQALTDSLVAQDNQNALNTRALLVVHQGHIVAESYAQNVQVNTPLLGWSMAKSLMSVMLGNLEYRKMLDVDETPGFTAWQQDERASIRIHELLTMTSGLAFSEEYSPGDDVTAMLFTEPSASDYAMQSSLEDQPGHHFNYSSGTASLLSRIYFERTGGTLSDSLADYRQHIAGPMSFQHSVFETDALGVFAGSSYFYASARDWARIGQLMLNGGVLNGHRIVSEDWVRRATQANDSENDQAYGYQWWLNQGNRSLRWADLPEDSFAAQGNRQQFLMVVPSADTVIVRLGWTSGHYPANERFSTVLQALTE